MIFLIKKCPHQEKLIRRNKKKKGAATFSFIFLLEADLFFPLLVLKFGLNMKMKADYWNISYMPVYTMANRLISFQMEGMKIESQMIFFLNFKNWTNGESHETELSSLQKSEFLKFIISFFHYFWYQN